MSVNIFLSHFSGSTTYPFIREALEQAMDLEEQVLANKAVIAPPGEGGQASQEVNLGPGGRNREGCLPGARRLTPGRSRSPSLGTHAEVCQPMGLRPRGSVPLRPCQGHQAHCPASLRAGAAAATLRGIHLVTRDWLEPSKRRAARRPLPAWASIQCLLGGRSTSNTVLELTA